MTLGQLRDYLNKMAHQDPKSLNKKFVVREQISGICYPVRSVDEGRSPAEISISIDNESWCGDSA